MRIVLFYHSLLSDWNHGNAHFLRGVVSELLSRGHEPVVYEPADGWSLNHLRTEHGEGPIEEFRKAYPHLKSRHYDLASLDLDGALEGADLAIVHEWNDPELVRRIGARRARGGTFRLLFHDTHHRSVTDPSGMSAYDLTHYDGVLAFGNVVRDLYLSRGWARRAWTWHEAADTSIFKPPSDPPQERDGDLVWIGNWGDDERTAELHEYLIEPVKALGLRAMVHGVRYPEEARAALADAGLAYGGWLPNFKVPRVFARYRVTVHVPRRPYATMLPGIPTIRPFEALACGIPLVSAPWDDVEGLFHPGRDYLVARDGRQMKAHLRDLLHDESMRRELTSHGLRTILDRHTCAHRVVELLEIARSLGLKADPATIAAPAASPSSEDLSEDVEALSPTHRTLRALR